MFPKEPVLGFVGEVGEGEVAELILLGLVQPGGHHQQDARDGRDLGSAVVESARLGQFRKREPLPKQSGESLTGLLITIRITAGVCFAFYSEFQAALCSRCNKPRMARSRSGTRAVRSARLR